MIGEPTNLPLLAAAYDAMAVMSRTGSRRRDFVVSPANGDFVNVTIHGVLVATLPKRHRVRDMRRALAATAVDQGRLAIAEISAVLTNELRVPAGHALQFDPGDFRWVEIIGTNTLCLWVGPAAPRGDVPTGLASEIRVFLDRPRATFFPKGVDGCRLTPTSSCHAAATYTELAVGLANAYNRLVAVRAGAFKDQSLREVVST